MELMYQNHLFLFLFNELISICTPFKPSCCKVHSLLFSWRHFLYHYCRKALLIGQSDMSSRSSWIMWIPTRGALACGAVQLCFLEKWCHLMVWHLWSIHNHPTAPDLVRMDNRMLAVVGGWGARRALRLSCCPGGEKWGRRNKCFCYNGSSTFAFMDECNPHNNTAASSANWPGMVKSACLDEQVPTILKSELVIKGSFFLMRVAMCSF